MPVTILGDNEITVDARIDDDHLWIGAEDLEPATGWVHKPDGLCRGDVCVPLRAPVEADDGSIDLGAVAAALGKKLVLDPVGPVAALADDPMGRGEVRNVHELALPDADGRMVDLSGLAGKKVVLIAWASW